MIEVFPVCRVVGSFTVRGHRGINRFRFNGRVHGERLLPGTYQIGLHTKRGRLLRVTIAIFDAPVARSAVASARKRNVCSVALSSFPGSTLLPPIAAESPNAASTPTEPDVSPQVLGVDVTAPRDIINSIGKNPFALAALGLAVLLLAVAAIPQPATLGGRAGDLLVRERPALVLAGAVALAVGVLILSLT